MFDLFKNKNSVKIKFDKKMNSFLVLQQTEVLYSGSKVECNRFLEFYQKNNAIASKK